MKPPVKALLIILTLAIGLPAMAWTGTFFYWHIRISAAISELEANPVHTGMDGGPHPSFYPLVTAGCRSMPYLIRTLQSSSDTTVLESISGVIDFHTWGMVRGRGGADETAQIVAESIIDSKDPPDHRRRNVQTILEWWEGNRSKHNAWWRVWSGRCR